MSAKIPQYKTLSTPEDAESTRAAITINGSIIDLGTLQYQEIVAYYNAAIKGDVEISSADRSKCQCEIARRNIENIKKQTAQVLNYYNSVRSRIRLS